MDSKTASHLAAWDDYRTARSHLLSHLNISRSNREPMAEFAEVLVADLMGGQLAESRTQKGWDVCLPDERKVQVRYLANRTGNWNNWHWVASSELWDLYALVVFVDLQPVAVHVFPSGDLQPLCTELGKRHAGQGRFLSYTYGNFKAIQQDPERFEALGMQVHSLVCG